MVTIASSEEPIVTVVSVPIKVTITVSLLSTMASSITETSMIADVSPAGIITIPVKAV